MRTFRDNWFVREFLTYILYIKNFKGGDSVTFHIEKSLIAELGEDGAFDKKILELIETLQGE